MTPVLIFYVHSNITIYLAKHYLQLNKIEFSDIIIFYDRVSLQDVEILPGRKFVFSNEFKSQHLYSKTFWPTYKTVNNFIKTEVKKHYHFFVPHILTEAHQIFASNRKCKKVIYIEEGDMSYYSEDLLTKRFAFKSYRANISRKIYSLGILYKKHPFPRINKKEEAICLHQDAFPFRNIEKHVYNFRDVFLNQNFKNLEGFNNGIVFLLDPFYPKEEYEREQYYTTLKSTFIYIKNNLGTKVYFKPHPILSSNTAQIEIILKIASECKIQGVLIDMPVELIIVNSINVKVISHFSSLLRYCCYANIHSYFWGYNLIKSTDLENPTPIIKFLHDNHMSITIIDG